MTQPLPGSDQEAEMQDPRLVLASKLFLCSSEVLDQAERGKLQEEILKEVVDKNLSGIYEEVCRRLSLTVDQAVLGPMRTSNEAKLGELDEKIKDAQDNLGETDVRDAMIAKAEYLVEIGNRADAEAAYKEAEEQAAGSGLKLDMIFTRIRLAILYNDWRGIKALVARGQQLCAEGGDWERKNKLKVYQGLMALAVRDFKTAADLLLESIATFTTHELFDYKTCVLYAVVAAMVALDRVELRKRVVDSPEVLQVIQTLPHVEPFLHSLYYCRYVNFFPSFVGVVQQLQRDLYMAPHVRFYMREMRLVAYTQFLDSYKSVTLSSMATAFGVSPDFLDSEVADFIVLGRLSAKIDKVGSVIESKRLDSKNYLYQQVIKQGDLLLNRIQKLSKVIDIE